jgi:large subunit ribosomal protein L29
MENKKMKIAEIRELSAKDLQERIAAERANLETLKMNHAISPLEDSSKIKKARKNIARMLTVLSQLDK